MKTCFSLLLTLILACALTACGSQASAPQQPQTPPPGPSPAGSQAFARTGGEATARSDTANRMTLTVASWPGGAAVAPAAEDAGILLDILLSDTWSEGTSDCLPDCVVELNGDQYLYHSSCGTLNDAARQKSLPLDAVTQQQVNAILEKYLPPAKE